MIKSYMFDVVICGDMKQVIVPFQTDNKRASSFPTGRCAELTLVVCQRDRLETGGEKESRRTQDTGTHRRQQHAQYAYKLSGKY